MESLTLMRLLEAKIAYGTQRQGVLSLNIANADTPNYQARDLKPFDFKTALSTAQAQGLAQTQKNHIQGVGLPSDNNAASFVPDTYEVAPGGNGVDIEEQLLKASRNNTETTIAAQLYAKQLSFMRMAIGADGGR